MKIIIKIAKKILAIIKIIKSINKYIDFKKIWDDFNEKHEVENYKRMDRPRNRRSLKKK
jgi:hypothetical protein